MNLYASIKNKLSIVLILLFSLGGQFRIYAQTKQDLEKKKKQLQQDIDYTNKLLSETKKDKKLSLNQLVTLNKKIGMRQELINTINHEIRLMDRQINDNNLAIKELETELNKLKDEYARMIYFAFKNQDAYSKLMYVFSAKDFDQAYMRLKYLQQYSGFRKKQAEEIDSTKMKLSDKIKELEQKKQQKRQLLTNEEQEKLNLKKEKNEQEGALNELQAKEQKLKKELEQKKRDAEKLQKAIQKIIEEEIRAAREKTAKENKGSGGYAFNEETKQLSKNFASNQRKLPWPLIQSIVNDHFGQHPHPLMPQIMLDNSGVDLSTTKGAIVRAVFEGEVTSIAGIPGAGKVVIVRHGEYLSVYANLKDVYVKQGDKVDTKQNIGTVLFNENEDKTELHFEIWKGQTPLDPEQWLFKGA